MKIFYKATIQRWMYALGYDKMFLCKTVMSTGRLQMLHDIFSRCENHIHRNHMKQFLLYKYVCWTLEYILSEVPENSETYREWGEVRLLNTNIFYEQKAKL